MSLVLDDNFDEAIDLPENITHLTFGNKFNKKNRFYDFGNYFFKAQVRNFSSLAIKLQQIPAVIVRLSLCLISV